MDRRPSDQSDRGRWRPARWWPVLLCALWIAGCQSFQPTSFVPPESALLPPTPGPNPVVINNMDRDFVWDQVVDVVDDYFRIQKEERVKLIGDMLTEGRIDTYPRGGSTIFEPWNKDSATPYDRWEATLQSIRRTALVRVIPAPQGFMVDVQVYKELENVVRPESGAVTLANSQELRNDNSLRRVTSPIGGLRPSAGWIPQGRDLALEQKILSHMQNRLGGVGVVPLFGEKDSAKARG